MRVIRIVVKPANISLSYQCRWRQLNQASSIQWRGRSNVASVPSDNLEPRKLRRKFSKQERRSMLENYVDKYRATNGGKFPTASEAKKDVGGSYYVVRQILQELKYKSEVLSIDKIDPIPLAKDVVENDEISANFGDVSQSQELGKVIHNDRAPADVSPFPSTESRMEADSVEHGQIRTDSREKVKGRLHSHPEADIKQESTSKDNVEFDGLQPKAEPQQATKSETSERELHKLPAEDAPFGKSSVWQNLKSFASGIFGRWRR